MKPIDVSEENYEKIQTIRRMLSATLDRDCTNEDVIMELLKLHGSGVEQTVSTRARKWNGPRKMSVMIMELYKEHGHISPRSVVEKFEAMGIETSLPSVSASIHALCKGGSLKRVAPAIYEFIEDK